MPATDVDFEREFEELARDLRALPAAAPQHVREHVRALGEPARPRTLHDLVFMFSWRRSLLVLAPVCVLALVSAAVIHGVVHSGGHSKETASAAQKLDAQVHRGALEGSGGTTTTPPVFGQATPRTLAPTLPTPTPGRYQDYEASLTLRVKGVDTLHDRTAEATRLARSYGGFVASVDESSNGGNGRSDLVLRIPVNRVEDAYFRLARLGTVTEQHLSIRDLDQVVQSQRRRIVQLKVLIARIGETLKSASLPADVRLRLELQRDAAKQELTRVAGSNKATLREASLSRISLTLTSQQAAATEKGGTSRIERAARDAGSFLAGAGAVVLFALIVLSPLIVLVTAWIFGSRAYRRREERRLLSAA
jgi:negative regulator of sigma E activity